MNQRNANAPTRNTTAPTTITVMAVFESGDGDGGFVWDGCGGVVVGVVSLRGVVLVDGVVVGLVVGLVDGVVVGLVVGMVVGVVAGVVVGQEVDLVAEAKAVVGVKNTDVGAASETKALRVIGVVPQPSKTVAPALNEYFSIYGVACGLKYINRC